MSKLELLTKTYELVIYGVQFYFDEQGNEWDNSEISGLCDEKFLDRAEEEGNVWTVNAFLRALEEINYGAGQTDFYNMTLRAYLINAKNPDDVIRVDHDNFLFNISELKHVSEVF